VNPVEYVFRIDAFSPETLPMGRLALYLAALAKMFGHDEHTHFVGVESGSAQLRTAIDAVDAPKVEARLRGVRIGDGPKEAVAAKHQLEDLLANDNALGTLKMSGSDQIVVPFTGRNRPKPITFPPFREDTSIDGVLVSIGGRDTTAHAILQDGSTLHVGVTMSRTTARELAPLLYGPMLRLHGNGKFERLADGVWKMGDFRVSRYEKLDNRPIYDVLEAIRGVPGNELMDAQVYKDITDLSGDDKDLAQ
jgi:hypothetical protein